MKKKVYILCILVLLGFYHNILACSCAGNESSVKRAIKESNVVLLGKIIEKRPFSIYDSVFKTPFNMVVYKLEVKLSFKGKINAQVIDIYTGTGDDDCGFNFSLGTEYLVYGYFRTSYYGRKKTTDKYIYTSVCSRTKITNESELNEIRKYRKPCTAHSTLNL